MIGWIDGAQKVHEWGVANECEVIMSYARL